MIRFERFSVSFEGQSALRALTLEVVKGESLGIAGESGSGKSLLLFSLLGLLPQGAKRGGRLTIDGIDYGAQPLPPGLIGMVFQEPMSALNPLKRIGDLITEPLRVHLHLSAKEAQARALGLLHDVELPEPDQKMRAYPHELSGGQRQRVVLALALALSPKILLADEPTTALDAHLAQQMLALLRRLCAARGMTLLLVSHDLSHLARSTERLAVLYGGDLVEDGPTEALLRTPKHPYTQGLLQARPQLRARGAAKARFTTIPGRVPDLPDLAKIGCRFAGRCPREIAPCRSLTPPMVTLEDRTVFCHLFKEAQP